MVVLTCRKQKSSSWSALEGKESVYSQLRMLLLWKFTNGPIPDHAANEISTAVHRAYPFGMWSSFDYTDSVFDCTTRRRSPSRPLYMKYENFSWLLMKNHWNLVHDYDPDEKEHGEEAPYSGFIPLSAKIVDCGLRERKFPSSVQQTIAKKSLVPGVCGHLFEHERRIIPVGKLTSLRPSTLLWGLSFYRVRVRWRRSLSVVKHGPAVP